jgi:hypothetical protein
MIELCIDFVFILDILISFFIAYEDKELNLEIRVKYIAVKYLKSWFMLDVCSSMPY